MKEIFVEKSILLLNGETCKNKINIVSDAMVQPFAEMIWISTGGDKQTLNSLMNILVTNNNTNVARSKLFI